MKSTGKTTASTNKGKNTTTSTATWIPKTGDSQKVMEYIIIAGIALGVLLVIGTIAFKKQHRK